MSVSMSTMTEDSFLIVGLDALMTENAYISLHSTVPKDSPRRHKSLLWKYIFVDRAALHDDQKVLAGVFDELDIF